MLIKPFPKAIEPDEPQNRKTISDLRGRLHSRSIPVGRIEEETEDTKLSSKTEFIGQTQTDSNRSDRNSMNSSLNTNSSCSITDYSDSPLKSQSETVAKISACYISESTSRGRSVVRRKR